MKKLISIGIVVALLAIAVVPGVVGADVTYDNPDKDSKIPFGILGSFFYLLEALLTPVLEEFAADLAWAAALMPDIGDWIGEPLAWMTELTAWTMVLMGDVVGVGLDIVGPMIPEDLDIDIDSVPALFYTIGARMYDDWGVIGGIITGLFPPAGG